MQEPVKCPRCKLVFSPQRQEGMEQIKQEYPNVFKPWSREADAMLYQLFMTERKDILAIAAALGRPPSAINRRIELLRLQPVAPTAPAAGFDPEGLLPGEKEILENVAKRAQRKRGARRR